MGRPPGCCRGRGWGGPAPRPRPHGCVRSGTPGPWGEGCAPRCDSSRWAQVCCRRPGPEQALGRDCPGRNLPEGKRWVERAALGLCGVDVSSSLCLLAVLGRPLTCLISAEPTGSLWHTQGHGEWWPAGQAKIPPGVAGHRVGPGAHSTRSPGWGRSLGLLFGCGAWLGQGPRLVSGLAEGGSLRAFLGGGRGLCQSHCPGRARCEPLPRGPAPSPAALPGG